jgi:GNAT superfamily N-acetyltransferase
MGQNFKMIIRKMLPEEIESVVTLFGYYREETLIPDETYDEQRLVQTIKNYTINWQLHFKIAFDGQRPVGVIGGFSSEDPVEKENSAAIQFCYLIPSHASRGNYRQLVEDFEDWAQQVGAKNIKVLDIGYKPNRLADLFDSMEYNPVALNIMSKEIT